MTTDKLAFLYALIPAYYQMRDAGQGGPLKALLEVIAGQMDLLDQDLEQLYDDLFIETSREWVVPYIADLIGARLHNELSDTSLDETLRSALSQRAQVANTMGYRRRKGTLMVLEQLARDVTGWDANVVEFFQLLSGTQSLKHLRPMRARFANLHRHEVANPVPIMSEADSLPAHCVDAHSITPRSGDATQRGRRGAYNIPNIGLFVWRIRPFPLENVPLYLAGTRRYYLDPAGFNRQLYIRPQTVAGFSRLAAPENIPRPITREELRRDLLRDSPLYYGAERSLALYREDGRLIPATELCVCNLAGWDRSPVRRLGIDPVLGRLALPAGWKGKPARADFCYGFSAEMGGGPYPRSASFTSRLKVKIESPADPLAAVANLAGDDGAIEISGNRRYSYTGLATISLMEGQHVELRASDGDRPVLDIDLAGLSINAQPGSKLTINGLLVRGGALRVAGALSRLVLRHCTLVPGLSPVPGGRADVKGHPSLLVDSPETHIEIDDCILGGLRASSEGQLVMRNSILDAPSRAGIAIAGLDDVSAGPQLDADACTFIGRVYAARFNSVSNSIFLANPLTHAEDELDGPAERVASVQAEQLQQGCVRFSLLPAGAIVPRRYHCLPEDPLGSPPSPLMAALHYGHAAYCQLPQDCPQAVFAGAEDGAEMGAFHNLFEPQRVNNLRLRLDEYLRFGLEAGIIFAS